MEEVKRWYDRVGGDGKGFSCRIRKGMGSAVE